MKLLSTVDVKNIRIYYADGALSITRLARLYGVSRIHIWDIINNHRRKNG